jgi:hypothetical protein
MQAIADEMTLPWQYDNAANMFTVTRTFWMDADGAAQHVSEFISRAHKTALADVKKLRVDKSIL